MFINPLLRRQDVSKNYPSSIRRAISSGIDMWIVLFIRACFMQLLFNLWIKDVILSFKDEFYQKFGTSILKENPEHMYFLINHSAFKQTFVFYLLVILVGALYYAYFNSSYWQASIGKRICKIMLIKENDNVENKKLGFLRAFFHYILSLLPFIFVMYIILYMKMHGANFYNAITASHANIFCGILFILWTQIHVFTKKRNTAYDMICKTVMVVGKTDKKFPWSK